MSRDMTGFFKVGEDGGTYVVACFYNPTTHETFTKCVRDYDYSDCSRDDDELYYMPINQDARRQWLHHLGEILEGDTVEVVKGRKVPIGTTGIVKAKKPFYDKYGRCQAIYVYLDNGYRTNESNCVLVKEG